jgi:hypothetical protein
MWFLRVMLAILGLVQIASGAMYFVAPHTAVGMFGITSFPDGFGFVLATAGGRSIGYGIGLLAAARRPWSHRLWINVMLGIQIVDFVSVTAYLAQGGLSMHKVGPFALLPVLWIVILGWTSLRSRRTPIADCDDPIRERVPRVRRSDRGTPDVVSAPTLNSVARCKRP